MHKRARVILVLAGAALILAALLLVFSNYYMDGTVNTYEVVLVDTLNPTEVGGVQNSGYDLVLYTCTYGGKARVTVFCNRSAGDVHPEDKNISNGEATE